MRASRSLRAWTQKPVPVESNASFGFEPADRAGCYHVPITDRELRTPAAPSSSSPRPESGANRYSPVFVRSGSNSSCSITSSSLRTELTHESFARRHVPPVPLIPHSLAFRHTTIRLTHAVQPSEQIKLYPVHLDQVMAKPNPSRSTSGSASCQLILGADPLIARRRRSVE